MKVDIASEPRRRPSWRVCAAAWLPEFDREESERDIREGRPGKAQSGFERHDDWRGMKTAANRAALTMWENLDVEQGRDRL